MILFLWCECICDVNWSFVGWSVFLRYVHAYKHIISYHITYYPMHEPVIVLPYRACHLILHLPQHPQVYPSSTRLRLKHTYIHTHISMHTYIHTQTQPIWRSAKCFAGIQMWFCIVWWCDAQHIFVSYMQNMSPTFAFACNRGVPMHVRCAWSTLTRIVVATKGWMWLRCCGLIMRPAACRTMVVWQMQQVSFVPGMQMKSEESHSKFEVGHQNDLEHIIHIWL